MDHYDPETDVVIVDTEGGFDQRYVDRFYLAAEVVSDSDQARVDEKREIYKLHPHCKCIMTIRQDRHDVRIDSRTASGWQTTVLQKADDILALDEFGVRCAVLDLYRGTPLAPRRR